MEKGKIVIERELHRANFTEPTSQSQLHTFLRTLLWLTILHCKFLQKFRKVPRKEPKLLLTSCLTLSSAEASFDFCAGKAQASPSRASLSLSFRFGSVSDCRSKLPKLKPSTSEQEPYASTRPSFRMITLWDN